MEDYMDIFFQRFKETMSFHPNLTLKQMQDLLTKQMIESITYMEETKGEPIVIEYKDHYLVIDGSIQSPLRRSLCYDKKARINRKKNAPISSALEECNIHHIQLVDEELYLYLQTLITCDTKTSSWIFTMDSIRNLGGALFGDHRYNRTFFYHNGADSYYSARGFRGYFILK